MSRLLSRAERLRDDVGFIDPPAELGLPVEHRAAWSAAGQMADSARAVLAGLRSSDTGERRRAATAEFMTAFRALRPGGGPGGRDHRPRVGGHAVHHPYHDGAAHYHYYDRGDHHYHDRGGHDHYDRGGHHYYDRGGHHYYDRGGHHYYDRGGHHYYDRGGYHYYDRGVLGHRSSAGRSRPSGAERNGLQYSGSEAHLAHRVGRCRRHQGTAGQDRAAAGRRIPPVPGLPGSPHPLRSLSRRAGPPPPSAPGSTHRSATGTGQAKRLWAITPATGRRTARSRRTGRAFPRGPRSTCTRLSSATGGFDRPGGRGAARRPDP